MELIYDYVETRDVVTRTECSREKESYDRTPRYTGYSHSVQWRADRLRVQIFSAGSRQGDLKSNFRQKLPDRYEISRKAKIGF